VCPTCRRPVARDGPQPAANVPPGVLGLFPAGQNRPPQPPANGQAAPGGGQPAQAGGAADNQQNNPNPNPNVRMFNLGPLRLGFAQGGVDEIREMAQRMRVPPEAVNLPAPTPTVATPQENNDLAPALDQIRGQLLALGQQVRQEMANVHNAAQEVHALNLLMNEVGRLRQLQQQQQGQQQATQSAIPGVAHGGQGPLQPQQQGLIHPFMHLGMQGPLPIPHSPHLMAARPPSTVTRHVGAGYGAAIPAGSPDLPEGVVIPPGWSLLPLQRLDGEAPPPEPTHNVQGTAQDVLRSVFANHPRSRGTSPAPSSGLSAQLGRPTAPTTSNIPDSSRRPGSQGGPSPDTAARRQPPVTAPIPLTPNWGGPAQLFGGDRTTGPMFGYQIEPRQGPHDEPGETSGDRPAASNPSTAVNGVTSGESSSGRRTGAAEVNGSTGDRGPRAVTVEEADDDDEQ